MSAAKNFFNNFTKTIKIGLIGCLFFYSSADIKSNKEIYFFRDKEYLISSVSKSINYIEKDINSLESIVSYLSFFDNYNFNDNDFYKALRINNAANKIKEYTNNNKNNNDKNIIVVDKTFQKALFFKNNNGKYEFMKEYDCGTAAVYGKKQRAGDGKTPEGVFEIYSIEQAHNKLWEGKKAYGAYFLRILGSIGIHGNGTDTVKVQNWRYDPSYKKPDPLGLYKENFSVGPSHGCIRLDNDVIRNLVENNEIQLNDKVIIYENKHLTEILKRNY
ncbi:MAG: L,D-transpeptidase [Candidatus Woesearchaeota archaeon]